MDVERRINPEQQLEILENLKPKLGKFFQEMVYGQWGLRPEDVRLVDEAGFGYTGVPIYGPELTQGWPHIDIAVLEDKYKGPRSLQSHPKKIIFPMVKEMGINNLPALIGQRYGISVEDLLKGSSGIFSLPTMEVSLAGTPALVPEPAAHVRVFAEETILFYELKSGGEEKIKEWFLKLKLLRDASQTLHKSDVQQAAQEAIEKSVARWTNQNWEWMVVN
ncbi:MAG: hypothetical protein NT149_00255 [Candidatus Gottesmanbacteria bacterium]|nr:hypothetical protein [Candidatus Gottesmanbacteria bacterium]